MEIATFSQGLFLVSIIYIISMLDFQGVKEMLRHHCVSMMGPCRTVSPYTKTKAPFSLSPAPSIQRRLNLSCYESSLLVFIMERCFENMMLTKKGRRAVYTNDFKNNTWVV